MSVFRSEPRLAASYLVGIVLVTVGCILDAGIPGGPRSFASGSVSVIGSVVPIANGVRMVQIYRAARRKTD